MGETENTFAKFGPHFQEMLLKGLLTDQKWAAQIEEVIKIEYFDVKYLAFLAEKYFDYSKKHRTYPSLKLLVTIVRGDLKDKAASDDVLCSQVVDFLKRIKSNDDIGDLPYVKEKALDFCRRQAFVRELENAIPLLADGDYIQIVNRVRAASMVGTVASIGHDFFEDADARFNVANRKCVPTGYAELDVKDVLNGGLAAGEIGVVVAATGVGKSHWLVSLGAHAMQRGLNVLHYTFELSDHGTAIRYDSHLTAINSSDVIDRKDDVKKFYEDNKKTMGKLIVKYFPTKSCTVQMIRSHIERLSVKGFNPDLIVLDYADVMRSNRQYEQPRLEITEVYEELRGLSGELQIPIWTASQSNRDGANSDMVSMENMAESYGKAQTADVVLTISRRPDEREDCTGRLFVAKNRAGRDGMMYDIAIDTAQSRFGIQGKMGTPKEFSRMDDAARNERKQQLWERLKKDKDLKIEN